MISFFNNTKGSISIMLAIILTALILLTGTIVDGARMRAAPPLVKSSLDLSAISLLTYYNNLLKEHYGLFALSENDVYILTMQIADSLEKNLMIKYDNNNERTFNLYNFKIEDLNVVPLYNLSENSVMRKQIVEYMKYRAPKGISEEFLDKILSFKDFSRQSKIMNKKLDLDKQFENIGRSKENLSESVIDINLFEKDGISQYAGNYQNMISQKIYYEKKIKTKLEDQRKLQTEISSLESQENDLEHKIDSLNSQIEESDDGEHLKSELSELESELQNIKEMLSSKKSKNDDSVDEISEIRLDLDLAIEGAYIELSNMTNYINRYIGYCIDALKSVDKLKESSQKANQSIDQINKEIENDSSDFADSMRFDTSTAKKDIDPNMLDKEEQQIRKNLKLFEGIEEVIKSLNVEDIREEDINAEVKEEIFKSVQRKLNFNESIYREIEGLEKINYYVPKSSEVGDKSIDPRSFIKNLTSAFSNKDKENEIIDDENFSNYPMEFLPSKGKEGKLDSSKLYKDILEKDKLHISKFESLVAEALIDHENTDIDISKDNVMGKMDFEDSSFAQENFNILSMMGNSLTGSLRSLRDELYVNEYIMDKFLHSLSEKKEQKTYREEKKLKSVKDGTRKTYFKNYTEIEYIIGGSQSEKANIAAVQAQITLIRFALNSMSVYTDPKKKALAAKISTAATSAAPFLAPVIHTLIMLSWAMAESLLDQMFIMSGQAVPIFKTKKTWVTSVGGDVGSLKEMMMGIAKDVGGQAVKSAIEYAEDNVQGYVKGVIEELNETINDKIDLAVDMAFEPIERSIYSVFDKVDDVTDQFADSIHARANDVLDRTNDKLIEIENDIYSKGPQLFEDFRKNNSAVFNELDILGNEYKNLEIQLREEVIGKSRSEISKIRHRIDEEKRSLIGKITDKLDKEKEYFSNIIKDEIKVNVDELKKMVEEGINDAAKFGKEKVDEFMDSIQGQTGSGVSKNSIKKSFISMKYEDYLRLLLILMNKETKMNRIQDVIQLNICEQLGTYDFMLSNYNTYIRIEAEVSMSFIFMTEAIIPKSKKTKNGRYLIREITYKGY
ncbi:UNVERIFIED_CONTAM: hypothetical protein Cloal_3367 [Acetivibrio alkalicellulosi]